MHQEYDEQKAGASSAESLKEITDDNLVAAARDGDMTAFGQLVERHRTACMRVATLMLRNRGDAEDEVQNAMWKAFQRLDQFRAVGPFSAWLSRIVENQCLMRLREQRCSRFVFLDETSTSKPGVELVAPMTSPEDSLGLQEVMALLRREVLRIPPLLRQVMIMRDLDQVRINDVALRLGVSVPAAKSRLMRTREELRSRIRKHCGKKGPAMLTQTSQYMRTAFK